MPDPIPEQPVQPSTPSMEPAPAASSIPEPAPSPAPAPEPLSTTPEPSISDHLASSFTPAASASSEMFQPAQTPAPEPYVPVTNTDDDEGINERTPAPAPEPYVAPAATTPPPLREPAFHDAPTQPYTAAELAQVQDTGAQPEQPSASAVPQAPEVITPAPAPEPAITPLPAQVETPATQPPAWHAEMANANIPTGMDVGLDPHLPLPPLTSSLENPVAPPANPLPITPAPSAPAAQVEAPHQRSFLDRLLGRNK